MDSDERRNGAGFRDRLTNQPDEPWPGEDGLKLDRKDARSAWHRVLTSHLDRYNAQTVEAMAGNLGWFNLRLTRKEVTDLVRSASGEGLIELEGDRGPLGERLAEADIRWRLTDKGAKLPRPRGASHVDVRHRVVDTARRTVTNAKGALTAAALIVGGGVGLSVAAGSLGAHILLVGGIWGFVFALVYGSYRDEQALTDCARAWPRLRDYRPARFGFETTWWRTPGPAAFLAGATVVAAVVICALFWNANKLPDTWWTVAIVLSGALLVAIVVGFVMVRRRAQRLRRAYREERRLRKALAAR